jgi:hypothetical protein
MTPNDAAQRGEPNPAIIHEIARSQNLQPISQLLTLADPLQIGHALKGHLHSDGVRPVARIQNRKYPSGNGEAPLSKTIFHIPNMLQPA